MTWHKAALARNIPDLLNYLGNEIARKWVEQNPVDAHWLDATHSRERNAMPDWYVNRILSRIVLFPISQQEQVLEELAGLYNTRVDELRRMLAGYSGGD
ncbi:MAG: hypothetical protein H6969_06910 [Gammaproteobacteria bacterium]|nr:hypothetical protein [Gammaproteobacteria bacterium]MCP5460008.1 hypothetical protein [Gammaproteobacteria bacterium]